MNIEYGLKLLEGTVGKPYVYGCTVLGQDLQPKAFDCAELVKWVFAQMGKEVVDGSYNQFAASQPVEGDLQPFDLGFLRANNGAGSVNHVVIYLGDPNGNIIHAKGEAHGVVKENAFFWAKRNGASFAGWRRLVDKT